MTERPAKPGMRLFVAGGPVIQRQFSEGRVLAAMLEASPAPLIPGAALLAESCAEAGATMAAGLARSGIASETKGAHDE